MRASVLCMLPTVYSTHCTVHTVSGWKAEAAGRIACAVPCGPTTRKICLVRKHRYGTHYHWAHHHENQNAAAYFGPDDSSKRGRDQALGTVDDGYSALLLRCYSHDRTQLRNRCHKSDHKSQSQEVGPIYSAFQKNLWSALPASVTSWTRNISPTGHKGCLHSQVVQSSEAIFQ
jgi:hypothetical protein